MMCCPVRFTRVKKNDLLLKTSFYFFLIVHLYRPRLSPNSLEVLYHLELVSHYITSFLNLFSSNIFNSIAVLSLPPLKLMICFILISFYPSNNWFSFKSFLPYKPTVATSTTHFFGHVSVDITCLSAAVHIYIFGRIFFK